MGTPSQQWPSILQNIIKTPNERNRLAIALGVTTMTLSRWANGEASPQRPHLIRMMQVVQPENRQDLLDALEIHFPEIHTWLREDTPEQVSSEFFAQVLNVRTTTTESLRFWRISDLVLKQALMQLDPNRLGMSIILVQCMPPGPDGKIRGLRERAGKGTFPWTADLEHDVHFLGLESMSGYAAEIGHVVYDDNLSQGKTFPAYPDEYEVSAAAHPIRLEGRIAGCLLASSTQLDFFSQQRLSLLAAFSDLISLAFDKHDFYPPNVLGLRMMPKPEVQRPIIATFRQRVTKKFQEARYHRKPTSNAEAELLVWKEIEAELLALSEESLEDDNSR
jgi:DNA-binding transcriptional regulator YiaG